LDAATPVFAGQICIFCKAERVPNRCSKAGHPVEVEPAQPEAFLFVCSFDQDVVWDWLFLSGALKLSDLSQSVVGPFGVICLCCKALGMPFSIRSAKLAYKTVGDSLCSRFVLLQKKQKQRRKCGC
jgi:hypothetical protein